MYLNSGSSLVEVMTKTRSQDSPLSQTDKFTQLARDLEANEDEAAFEETLKRIAPKGPPIDKADPPQQ